MDNGGVDGPYRSEGRANFPGLSGEEAKSTKVNNSEKTGRFESNQE